MSIVYKQENIEINDIILPSIEYKRDVYYPLTYVFEKILLKKKQSISVLKKRGYEEYLLQFKVDFGFNDGGAHNTYCISKKGLIELLKGSYVGGLTIEQKQGMNCLLEYFNEDLINEEPRFLSKIKYKNSDNYDEFEKDCIEKTLKLFGDLEWQLCTKCNKYYHLHGNFFRYSTKYGLGTICRNCLNTDNRHMIAHPDSSLTKIYRDYGKDVYKCYKNHEVLNIYNHYIENKIKSFPDVLTNKKDILTIIKHLYNSGKINKDNITISILRSDYRLPIKISLITMEEIYECLFGENPRYYPWHYSKYKVPKYSVKESRIVFNNYLIENNIVINDIYSFNYSEILIKARLRQFDKDISSFIVLYHDNKYPAYKFSVHGVNYWKSKENRNRELKYLIEKDMKLEIKKIPLYLTITSIKSISNTMYNVLKNYYSGLYEWVNEVYPDIFDPKDFDINYMRNEFDSVDEQTIDDILRSNFDNVLYNPKHNKYTIKLLKKIPDWFIFTTSGVIIVEYFGLWVKKRGMYNSRTRDYINSSKDKVEKYKALEGYKFLYIFPEDLEDNYKGLYSKIDEIKYNKKLK